MRLGTGTRSARMTRSALAASLILLLMTGCTTLGWGDGSADDDSSEAITVFYEEGDDRVALAPATGAARENDHPVELDASEVSGLLGGVDIVVREAESANGANQDQTRPLFEDGSLENLSEPIVDALREARSDQDVLIRVKQVRRSPVAGWFQKPGITTARLFHRDNHLHLVAGAVGVSPFQDVENLGIGRTTGEVKSAVGTLPAGSREAASAEAPELRSAFASRSRGEHRTWLALDRSVTADAQTASDREQTATRAEEDRERDPDADSEPEASDADLQDGVSGDSSRQPTSESLPASTEARLQRLRELRRQELISESVYESLVRDALREEGTLPENE